MSQDRKVAQGNDWPWRWWHDWDSHAMRLFAFVLGWAVTVAGTAGSVLIVLVIGDLLRQIHLFVLLGAVPATAYAGWIAYRITKP